MSGIGTSPPRPDGWGKVAGEARYGDDRVLPGLWYGATVRSPHPHARIRGVLFDAERAPAGTLFLTAADLPGVNGIQLLDDSWPALANGMVQHVGEAVALVVAPTRLAAEQAAAAVEVEYQPLPPVLDWQSAAAQPPLSALDIESGDVERALAGAEHIVEGEYRSGHQEHIYIECQVMTAWWSEGAVVVEGSMQCPYYVHKALMHALALPAERVRVRASVVGGGFGGKEDYPSMIAVHAAIAAARAARPVRFVYDRHEDIVGTTKRHPALIRHRAGVDGAGRLLGLDIELLLDGGAYTTLSPVVLSRAALHAAGPYRCDNVRIRARALRTHTAPNGAFRGFGSPQAQFAMERQMDRIARVVGLDPFEIRLRNALGPGDRLPTGQTLDATASARECLEEVERRTGFRRRWREAEAARAAAAGGPRRGLGLSLYFHGAGFTGNGERRMRSPVGARLLEDGRLEILTAMTDMGQGCAAIFPQIARAAGDLGPDDVVFAEPDTAAVPDSGPTVASRTTMIVGGLIARAVVELRQRVVDWWTASHSGVIVFGGAGAPAPAGLPFREVARRYREEVGPLEITLRHEPPDWQRFDDESYRGAAYPTYAWGADVVEVEVDPDLLEVRPLEVTAVCEVGRAIHPTLCAGQVEGGTLQALGWGLCEEMKVDGGRYRNDRLATYIIPTIRDAPRMSVHLLEHPWEGGPFGAKGVGELPMDGGAPAAVAAIENAVGVVATEIPATPERLEAWRRAGQTVEPAG